jgi:NAD(P)-dependent dehydrogenase (short-subunit alcohol dehydrogenase family)
MADRFAGRVAFITGAARGQGRAHAVRFAEEGADILAVDLCRQMPSVAYPMATPEDLAETVELVHKTGRRIVAVHADVRDPGQLQAAVQRCVAELGRIDFVLANAGILPVAGEQGAALDAFVDAIDVMLKASTSPSPPRCRRCWPTATAGPSSSPGRRHRSSRSASTSPA